MSLGRARADRRAAVQMAAARLGDTRLELVARYSAREWPLVPVSILSSMRSRWNLDPYRSFANIRGICWRMMPGPLSVTVTRKRFAWLRGGGDPPLATASTLTTTSGRIPASSQASSALSTASLTQVSSAFRGLSNPKRCRFLVKNSETEISRWLAPISTADTASFGCVASFGWVAGGLVFGGLSVRLRVGKGFFDNTA